MRLALGEDLRSPDEVATGQMRKQPTTPAGPATPVWNRFDVLLSLAASGLVLSFIWRLQNLFTPWALIQGPSLMAGAGLVLLFASGRHRLVGARAHHAVGLATLGVLIAVAVSVPWSLYPGLSFNFLFGDFAKTLLMMAVIIAAIRTIAHLERLVLVCVLGAGLYCLYVVTNFTVGTSGRLGKLIYYDANDLALWLVVAIPLAGHLILRPTSRAVRIAGLVTLPLLLAVFTQTGSRGGFIGLAAVACYMLLGYRQFSVAKRLGVSLALFFGLSLFASEAYWELMATLLDPTSDYNWSGTPRGGGRMNIWRRGLGYMFNDPLTGVGARAFPVAEGTVSKLAVRQEWGIGLKWSAAHNSFVQVGAELGVLGLAAFVTAIGASFRSLARIAKRSPNPSVTSLARAISASLVGYCAAGFFVSQAYGAGLYMLLGWTIGLWAVARSPVPVAARAPRRRGSRRATRASAVGAAARRAALFPAPRSGVISRSATHRASP